jgi:AbrB family looped-hinge helix DNA binding protein
MATSSRFCRSATAGAGDATVPVATEKRAWIPDLAELVGLPRSRPAPIDMWEMCYASHMSTVRGTARLDERGRLVLPAELRRRLGLNAGDEVAITEEADGALRIESRLAAARALIGLAGSLDHSSLDDLRAVRREQAESEASASVRPNH